MAKLRKATMHDLLLPIIFTLCILPFIIYLAVYSSGFGSYQWCADNDIIYDFYAVYRGKAFVIVAAISLVVLIFYMGLYKEECKKMKVFYPLFAFAGFAVLSAFTSIDKGMSLKGAPYSNETIWVVLSYLVISIYTYQMIRSGKDYQIIYKAVWVLTVCMLAVGFLQVFNKDLLDYEWVQRLVMSKGMEEGLVGHVGNLFSAGYVYLTLFNPNYAGQFLAMLVVFFLVMMMTEDAKKKRYALGVSILLTAVLLFFTYSRAAVLACFAGALFVMFLLKVNKKGWLILTGIVIVLAAGGIGLDAARDFRFMNRLFDVKEEIRLTEMTTSKSGVTLCYDGVTETVGFGDIVNERTICDGKVEVKEQEMSGNRRLVLKIDDREWNFVRMEEGGEYYYLNEVGKYDSLVAINKVDLHGFEYLASGRGYIWSRVLPLIKKYFFFGSGPDTFLVAYPQNDYVGKANYSHDTAMIIEKAHNGYLMLTEQYGVPAFICFILFCVLGLKQAIPYYRNIFAGKKITVGGRRDFGGEKADSPSVQNRMGAAAAGACVVYLVSLITNDFNLFVTPFAAVLVAITLAAANSNGRE